MNLDRRIQLFVVLAAVFVTSLVAGDIIGVKLFEVHLGPVLAVMSAGMLLFPVTFLLTDILNEFYGKRVARFVTWVGFFMAIFTFVFITVAVRVPWAPMTEAAGYSGTVAGAFNNVFAGSQRILMASIVAYLVGQFADIAVFNLIKRTTQNRMLWLRATGSTVVSQLIDTVVVQYIAWTPMGNTVSAIRSVQVDDRTPPTLRLRGAARLTHTCGSGWVDPGVEAMDA